MNQSTIKEYIGEIKKSIIYLNNINDNESLVMANNDLKHYEILLSGFSIPALVNTSSN